MKSECTSCSKIFKSVAAFDKHRTGSYGDPIYKNNDPTTGKVIRYTKPARRCMTTEEMLAAGMCQNERGWWITIAYDPSAYARGETEEEEVESV